MLAACILMALVLTFSLVRYASLLLTTNAQYEDVPMDICLFSGSFLETSWAMGISGTIGLLLGEGTLGVPFTKALFQY